MKKVCLRFETILKLSEFLDLVTITNYHIDRIRNVITGELCDADIELAKRCYRAKVMRVQMV